MKKKKNHKTKLSSKRSKFADNTCMTSIELSICKWVRGNDGGTEKSFLFGETIEASLNGLGERAM